MNRVLWLLFDIFNGKSKKYSIITFDDHGYYSTDGISWHRGKLIPLPYFKTLHMCVRYYLKNEHVYLVRNWNK